MAAPSVAFLDIETAPIDALVWTMFEANVAHVNEPTFVLSYSLKWQGSSRVRTRAICDYPAYKNNKKTDKFLVQDLWKDLDKADVVIAHNGDAFDIKKINARFAVYRMGPVSPFKTVDTLKIARRHFKFDSNKLDNLGRYLELGAKLPHTGMHLWLGCMRGDQNAWRIMKRYNARDVVLLEQVYEVLKPWATSHPDMRAYDDAPGCPTCRSKDIQRRGFNVAKKRKTQRLQCRGCGAWFAGAAIKA